MILEPDSPTVIGGWLLSIAAGFVLLGLAVHQEAVTTPANSDFALSAPDTTPDPAGF